MKCIMCDNETGSDKKQTCSGSCRAKLQRRTRTVEKAHAQRRTVEAHAQPDMVIDLTSPERRKSYIQVVGVKVYNRQAVVCSQFGTRPEPLNNTDQPVPFNRGRYVTKEGICYQFDVSGRSFECKHEYKDEDGVLHLAAYETTQDVKEANAARQGGS